MRRAIVALGAFLVSNISGAASGDPPLTIVDDGACPFECCTYRDWTVEAATRLLDRPHDHSRVVGTVRKGEIATGLTGRVVVLRPGQITVTNACKREDGCRFSVGDTVWVYTERGEGYFKVWYQGQFSDEEAGFMYQDRGGWDRCVEDGTCWGERKSFPLSEWWVKVRTRSGISGWTKEHMHFGNMDACG